MPELLHPAVYVEEVDTVVRTIDGVPTSTTSSTWGTRLVKTRIVRRSRLHPRRCFGFRLKWQGRDVAGIEAIGGLDCTTDVVEYREGGNPIVRHEPGRTKYSPLMLEWGLVDDPEFEQWLNSVRRLGADPPDAASLKGIRRDVRIELFDEAGRTVLAYDVFRCWPSALRMLPALDARTLTIPVRLIRLENDGWERDLAVPMPAPPVGERKHGSRRRRAARR